MIHRNYKLMLSDPVPKVHLSIPTKSGNMPPPGHTNHYGPPPLHALTCGNESESSCRPLNMCQLTNPRCCGSLSPNFRLPPTLWQPLPIHHDSKRLPPTLWQLLGPLHPCRQQRKAAECAAHRHHPSPRPLGQQSAHEQQSARRCHPHMSIPT